MASTTPRLPEFSRPPLTEVALTVQFEKVDGFRTVHAGLLWDRLRRELPNLEHVEEHPPIEQAIESPGPIGVRPSGVRVEVVDTPGLPRLFFLTHDKTQLIQLQVDRLSHNWRKVGGTEPYPRYEQIRGSRLRPRRRHPQSEAQHPRRERALLGSPHRFREAGDSPVRRKTAAGLRARSARAADR